jgi:hypothetical protein
MTARHCLMDDHCDKGSQRKITTKQNTETGTPSPFQTMLTTAVYISIGNQITVSHAIGRVLCLYLCLYSAGFSIPNAAAGFVTVLVGAKNTNLATAAGQILHTTLPVAKMAWLVAVGLLLAVTCERSTALIFQSSVIDQYGAVNFTMQVKFLFPLSRLTINLLVLPLPAVDWRTERVCFPVCSWRYGDHRCHCSI